MNFKEIKEKAKEKVEKAKEKTAEGLKKVGEATVKVITSRPAMAFSAFVAVGGTMVGILSGAGQLGKDSYEHSKVTDEVTGLDYLAKHPLTNSEILELSDRMVDGETTGEALNNMGLLRNEKKRR